jgi:RNA recognition motif-containing protein
MFVPMMMDESSSHKYTPEHREREPTNSSANNSQLRKFFIGGLSWNTTEESVKIFFERLGFIVEKAQIMRNKSSGRSRGFGFIILLHCDRLDQILPSYELDGRQIEVKYAVPKEEMGAKTKKIFVGGLPVSLSEATFYSHFQKYGAIVEAQIMKDRKNSRSRGFGFIRYQSEESVEEVLKFDHTINGKLVEVKKALPKHALSSMNQEELSMVSDEPEMDDYAQDFPTIQSHHHSDMSPELSSPKPRSNSQESPTKEFKLATDFNTLNLKENQPSNSINHTFSSQPTTQQDFSKYVGPGESLSHTEGSFLFKNFYPDFLPLRPLPLSSSNPDLNSEPLDIESHFKPNWSHNSSSCPGSPKRGLQSPPSPTPKEGSQSPSSRIVKSAPPQHIVHQLQPRNFSFSDPVPSRNPHLNQFQRIEPQWAPESLKSNTTNSKHTLFSNSFGGVADPFSKPRVESRDPVSQSSTFLDQSKKVDVEDMERFRAGIVSPCSLFHSPVDILFNSFSQIPIEGAEENFVQLRSFHLQRKVGNF